MATFVLVHGAWHGGWCWDGVATRLRAAGHAVEAPDLPAHGDDPAPAAAVSLACYVETIGAVVATRQEPVVLVGHGKAGSVISEVAERWPERVTTLVYLAAFLLSNGESVIGVGTGDAESCLVPNLVRYPTQGVMTVRPEALRDVFYHDCAGAEIAGAIARICPEPIAPAATPIRVSPERFGCVRRVYVETRRDRALGPTLQRRMQSALPCQRVFSLETGHAPFLAAPAALASVLLGIAPLRPST
jgi:pimeloyl-ACP methyl ester carboxylesterase